MLYFSLASRCIAEFLPLYFDNFCHFWLSQVSSCIMIYTMPVKSIFFVCRSRRRVSSWHYNVGIHDIGLIIERSLSSGMMQYTLKPDTIACDFRHAWRLSWFWPMTVLDFSLAEWRRLRYFRRLPLLSNSRSVSTLTPRHRRCGRRCQYSWFLKLPSCRPHSHYVSKSRDFKCHIIIEMHIYS